MSVPSFCRYFYYFSTPPHILLILLCCYVLTIASAIPVTSSSNQFRNQLRASPNSAVGSYSKFDDFADGFADENFMENVVKDIGINSYRGAESEDINPPMPLTSNTDANLNAVMNRIIESMTEDDLSQMDKNSFEILRKQIEKVKDEEDIQLKSELLQQILLNYPEGPLPILYVEESKPMTGQNGVDKRSGRYYRRYPWKRQQKGKGSYDPDARYMCTPTRDEIFRLLVGLHETHKGNERKLVNFCNRRRPAKTVFTNIRFLG
ncbi:uncharacterized protein LOC134832018 [Culicoides brevitarsis]|uniref:uncharacterized protein LOC134832018 n=1 Tax=Culicoides brevitarsis TaxID=469753 RepID=UPI00307BE405